MIETDSDIQIYGNYDKALVRWVHDTCYWPFHSEDRKKVICVFSTPERAFAQVWKKLHPSDTSDGYRQKRIPLPFISVNRVPGWTYDSTRDNKHQLNKYDEDTGRFDSFSWPIPVIINYSVSFWSRNLRDEDGLLMQIYRAMGIGPIQSIPVDHPEPFGSKYGTIKIENDIRMDPIVSDEKQRVMRRELNFSMTGWITREDGPSPVLPVETVHSHLEEQETGEDLGTVIVPTDCD